MYYCIACSGTTSTLSKVITLAQPCHDGVIIISHDVMITRYKKEVRMVFTFLPSPPAPSLKDSIHLLLCRGADPNVSPTPMPPLLYSIKAGDVAAVQKLVERGANTRQSLPTEVGKIIALMNFSLLSRGLELKHLPAQLFMHEHLLCTVRLHTCVKQGSTIDSVHLSISQSVSCQSVHPNITSSRSAKAFRPVTSHGCPFCC